MPASLQASFERLLACLPLLLLLVFALELVVLAAVVVSPFDRARPTDSCEISSDDLGASLLLAAT